MTASDRRSAPRGGRARDGGGDGATLVAFLERARPPFGDLLRRYRLRAGLSQGALAERAGLSERGISDLERGRRAQPQAATIGLLADALALAPDERERFAGAARRAPGPRSAAPRAAGAAGGLPLPPNRLLGRDAALAAATALLADGGAALLTITGPGGVGKSHFALALAHELRGRARDGAYFVPLAALGDPAAVPGAIAQVLGLAPAPPRPLDEQVAAAIGGGRVLLVLDNFEQLLPAGALVERLLARCVALTIVVTSRAPLRLRREREFALPPLALPAEGASSATVAAAPAVQLLAARATAIRADFAVTAENAATLAAICRRLDGLPLALELAAARLRLLTPAGLLAGLAGRSVALRGAAPDLPERHRTLDAVIAWSYDLLGPVERRLFRCLGVFQGGATIAALAAVAGVPPTAALDGAEVLVAHSLAQVAAGGDEPRLTLLETLRAFALDRLARGPSGSGEERATPTPRTSWRRSTGPTTG